MKTMPGRRTVFSFLRCLFLLLFSPSANGETPLVPGDYTRTLKVDGRPRSYLIHVPAKYNSKQPTPVVLAYHGVMTNGPFMAVATNLNVKADDAGFIAVYPNGTGKGGLFLAWNSGGIRSPSRKELPDDVKFTEELLDDLAKVLNVDPKRVCATGMSNGGMMCYRLANELSQRIAAIAPVTGAMATDTCHPQRPGNALPRHRRQARTLQWPQQNNGHRGELQVRGGDDSDLGTGRWLSDDTHGYATAGYDGR
jgi:polyhydroxybutyrate depolymerase